MPWSVGRRRTLDRDETGLGKLGSQANRQESVHAVIEESLKSQAFQSL